MHGAVVVEIYPYSAYTRIMHLLKLLRGHGLWVNNPDASGDICSQFRDTARETSAVGTICEPMGQNRVGEAKFRFEFVISLDCSRGRGQMAVR